MSEAGTHLPPPSKQQVNTFQFDFQEHNYSDMDQRAVWSTFRAKPGKEAEVESFLEECRQSIQNEAGTTTFFALKTGPGSYAIFDTFHNDQALETHRNGPTAQTVMKRAAELFDGGLDIVQASILTSKT